jgi:hypothetical protein
MFPTSISLPGAQTPDAAPQDAAAQQSDPTAAVTAVRKAKVLISQALLAEVDHEDAVLLERVNTELQKYLAAHQKLTDNPGAQGVKALRKFAGA